MDNYDTIKDRRILLKHNLYDLRDEIIKLVNDNDGLLNPVQKRALNSIHEMLRKLKTEQIREIHALALLEANAIGGNNA